MDREKFMKSVEMVTETGCWLWTGWLFPHGYGRCYSPSGSRTYAHRVAYELFVGNIPEHLSVLHHCDVKCCVNPAHLYTGTQGQNVADAVARKRNPRGVLRKLAKLDDAAVREIRASSMNMSQLGKKFGVSTAAIRQVLLGISWNHVE